MLDFLITRYLVQKYPGFNPASLNDLKQATINGENFACTALHHGLHVYLQKVSPILETQIEVFATSFWKEGGSAFGITNLSSPRVGCLSLPSQNSLFLLCICQFLKLHAEYIVQ